MKPFIFLAMTIERKGREEEKNLPKLNYYSSAYTRSINRKIMMKH
jgi:hypothetical protein